MCNECEERAKQRNEKKADECHVMEALGGVCVLRYLYVDGSLSGIPWRKPVLYALDTQS